MYVKLHVCTMYTTTVNYPEVPAYTVTTPQTDIYTPEVPETKEPVKNPETEQPESEEAE